ncbi:spore coat protein GerQ [Sporosarcina sp. JAI121]|uniref:spore coat protein GerQ n=1 Tax=Sporosarcina sp. JAI121 TaxID=2723064 RepID=UPI0015CCC291|nr:spore coat protein GerQ [Sporosarcina sp. JAI121]NYF23436.1 spore germination protein Q [Sporosarcina sp. JAI121]
MVQYYWNQPYQNQHVTPPPVTLPAGGRQPGPPRREESYIENILRLNRGEPGTFHFSFEHALDTGKNTKAVRGTVEAAGRDHVILSDSTTGHRFLFPMIYFDYAEFDNEVKYFPQAP